MEIEDISNAKLRLAEEKDEQYEKEFQRGRNKVKQGDLHTAKEIFSSLTMRGHSKAMTYLAIMYLKGKGVDQNINRGLSLLLSAARLGDVDAMSELGDVFESKGDMRTSMEWHRKAADRGSVYSKNFFEINNLSCD